jgi:excisionase family DNA binding protein
MNQRLDPVEPSALLVSLRDARRTLGGVSNQTLYRLVADGQITLIKIRRRSFIRRSELDDLIRRSIRGVG